MNRSIASKSQNDIYHRFENEAYQICALMVWLGLEKKSLSWEKT